MPKRTRATLRSQWWLSFFRSIRFCYSCGGKLKRVYVKEEKSRRHVCSKCKTITYVNPKIVVGVIPVLPDGRVLLLRRGIEPAINYWTYPAGFQEIGENVEKAGRRETLEEIGVHVTLKSLQGIYSYEDAGVVTIVFVGRVKKGDKPKVTPEAREVRAYRRKDIPWKDLAFRSTHQALRDWMRQQKR